MERWQEEIRKQYGYKISNSLIRSKARTRSLIYIVVHPDKTILEISSGIRVTYTNTHGAIIGDGKKYSTKLSLTGLNLVLYEKNDGRGGICKPTDKGKEIFDILNGRIDQF